MNSGSNSNRRHDVSKRFSSNFPSKQEFKFNQHKKKASQQYRSVAKPKLYDYLTKPNGYSPKEKKDALEGFLQPENYYGLNMFKNEMQAKLQEKEEMENVVNMMQLQLKEMER
mmetsp:Transcript_24625/g.24221  ORF Transcript_24625/g.24221 Transcript_24625/m.24221 type:complete len:113 (-) Transcript_24625:512-850(-)